MIDFRTESYYCLAKITKTSNQSFSHFKSGSNLRIIDERYKATTLENP